MFGLIGLATRAAVTGAIVYGVVKVLDKAQVAEKVTAFGSDLLTRFSDGIEQEERIQEARKRMEAMAENLLRGRKDGDGPNV